MCWSVEPTVSCIWIGETFSFYYPNPTFPSFQFCYFLCRATLKTKRILCICRLFTAISLSIRNNQIYFLETLHTCRHSSTVWSVASIHTIIILQYTSVLFVVIFRFFLLYISALLVFYYTWSARRTMSSAWLAVSFDAARNDCCLLQPIRLNGVISQCVRI